MTSGVTMHQKAYTKASKKSMYKVMKEWEGYSIMLEIRKTDVQRYY